MTSALTRALKHRVKWYEQLGKLRGYLRTLDLFHLAEALKHARSATMYAYLPKAVFATQTVFSNKLLEAMSICTSTKSPALFGGRHMIVHESCVIHEYR